MRQMRKPLPPAFTHTRCAQESIRKDGTVSYPYRYIPCAEFPPLIVVEQECICAPAVSHNICAIILVYPFPGSLYLSRICDGSRNVIEGIRFFPKEIDDIFLAR
jgi:hypothetical protein